MGWSIGFDAKWNRDVGYGIPAWCDHSDCAEKIDRGLSYVCGGEPRGGEHGCGLYFCENHLGWAYTADGYEELKDEYGEVFPQMCERCVAAHEQPQTAPGFFEPKPDHPEWIDWKLTDSSWQQWRNENPETVAQMRPAG